MVFCGPGNNGGDGLALARQLKNYSDRFSVRVFLFADLAKLSGSVLLNYERLINDQGIDLCFIRSEEDLPTLDNAQLLVDALFGSGLNRPLEGVAAMIVDLINQSDLPVLSVDVPSGLMGENNSNIQKHSVVHADVTITFQFPKLSFLFPENESYVGNWLIKDIGLHPEIIKSTDSPFCLMEDADVIPLMIQRSKFSHKGSCGHALLISGSYGKMGAAVLASKACLRSGTGLLTAHVPHTGYSIVQISVPEAMTSIDDSDLMFTGVNSVESFSAIGIGPGIGKKVNTQKGLKNLLSQTHSPMVLDADALNILSDNKDWLHLMPEGSILTPHPKEFERLVGKSENSFERMNKALRLAKKHHLVVVVKGAHTMIVNSKGEICFNTTGNPGMATAGSGDVLTGIILGLLAQGYSSDSAARIGVYVHGLAGDIAFARRGAEALIASDIIENLGEAFKLLHK
jgi:NAD(P)H-hydrate epimerase